MELMFINTTNAVLRPTLILFRVAVLTTSIFCFKVLFKCLFLIDLRLLSEWRNEVFMSFGTPSGSGELL